MKPYYNLSSRAVLMVSMATNLLQGLFTADISNLEEGDFCFSALLNAKGRFLFDFFIHKRKDYYFIDINAKEAENFIKAIKQYDLLDELSMKVEPEMQVYANEIFLKKWKEGIFDGRFILENYKGDLIGEEVYNEERIKFCLPDGALELKKEKSIILEFGYDEANGISFNKGCYIGQELMNRTKRQGTIRKGLHCIKGEVRETDDIKILSKFGDFTLVQGRK